MSKTQQGSGLWAPVLFRYKPEFVGRTSGNSTSDRNPTSPLLQNELAALKHSKLSSWRGHEL